jgi:hypothetical protein
LVTSVTFPLTRVDCPDPWPTSAVFGETTNMKLRCPLGEIASDVVPGYWRRMGFGIDTHKDMIWCCWLRTEYQQGTQQVGARGGGILNGGSLQVSGGVTIAFNSAPTGGGLYNNPRATASVTQGCSINGNTTSGDGAGLYNGNLAAGSFMIGSSPPRSSTLLIPLSGGPPIRAILAVGLCPG